jgi:4-amino-4-deoxy-L-arabinose transferase-like glycosyltransferase
MLETGDFVRIAVQDAPRNKKPIGIHWLQAASVSLVSTPEARAIWAYRLPSLVGALLAACACFWGGTVLVGRRAAFIGASLLAACVLLSTEAMIAKTDATLCGFTTLAMAALARMRMLPEAAKRYALVFWAALGAGILIKGPITPLVAGLTLLALFIWEKRAAWMKPLVNPLGPLLCAAIVAPWFIAIGQATHGRFFVEAVGGDMGRKVAGGDEGHGVPFGAHLLLLPILSFPIAVGLPAAARLIWRAVRAPRTDQDNAAFRFLIAWAAPIWFVFEALPTKLVHYPLPAYPAIALMAGAGLTALYRENWVRMRLAGAALMLLAGAVLTGLCGYLATLAPGDHAADLRRATQTALAVGAIFVVALGVFVFARKPAGAVAALVAALAFVFVTRQHILPSARTVLVSQQASFALRRADLHPLQHPKAPRLLSVGYEEPSFVFMTRTDTLLAHRAEAANAAIIGEAAIVEDRERASFETGLAARKLAFAPMGDAVDGLDYSNGDNVRLQPGIIRAAGTAPQPAPSKPRPP